MTADQLTKGQTAVIVACNNQPMQDIGFIPSEMLKILEVACLAEQKWLELD